MYQKYKYVNFYMSILSMFLGFIANVFFQLYIIKLIHQENIRNIYNYTPPKLQLYNTEMEKGIGVMGFIQRIDSVLLLCGKYMC